MVHNHVESNYKSQMYLKIRSIKAITVDNCYSKTEKCAPYKFPFEMWTIYTGITSFVVKKNYRKIFLRKAKKKRTCIIEPFIYLVQIVHICVNVVTKNIHWGNRLSFTPSFKTFI
jgi:hypothetical protein